MVPPLVLTLTGLVSVQDQSKPPMFEGGMVFLKLKVLFKPSPALKTFCTVIGSVISGTQLGSCLTKLDKTGKKN